MTKTAPKSAAAASITVVGPAEGRRRIGRRFGPEPVTIPLDDLSDDEISALRADKRLIVSETGAASTE